MPYAFYDFAGKNFDKIIGNSASQGPVVVPEICVEAVFGAELVSAAAPEVEAAIMVTREPWIAPEGIISP
jgi:hypothetical protein